MTRRRSLRRDLALGIGAGVTLLWLLAMGLSGAMLREEIDEFYDAALQKTAERLLPLVETQQGRAAGAPVSDDWLRVRGGKEALSYVLRRGDGTILMRSAGADDRVFAGPAHDGFRVVADHRIFGLSNAAGDRRIEVADPLVERRDATLDAMVVFLVPALLVLPLSLFGAAWFMRNRLAPLAALSDAVRGRGAQDLAPLDVPELQVELAPVQSAVNRLMARLEDALEAERSFSADAAHELRTPIAAALARVQRLVAQAPPGPLAERARGVEAELKRIGRLSEKLLDLARAEGQGLRGGAPTDAAPILALVAEEAAPAAALRLDLPERPVMTRMDPDALAILARNLIENALVHGAPPVLVSLDPAGVLRVVNGGPPTPAAMLPRLTRRFERAGSRSPGSGLGLAIVAALARNSGVALAIRSPAPGREDGFEVAVMLGGATEECADAGDPPERRAR